MRKSIMHNQMIEYVGLNDSIGEEKLTDERVCVEVDAK
jgi:hypothetical protein